MMTSPLKYLLAQLIESGQVTLDHLELEKYFPHPTDRGLADMEFNIALAVAGVPPIMQPTQEERIEEFCEENNVLHELDQIHSRTRFVYLQYTEPKAKPSAEHCEVGDFLMEWAAPEAWKGKRIVQMKAPLPEPDWREQPLMAKLWLFEHRRRIPVGIWTRIE